MESSFSSKPKIPRFHEEHYKVKIDIITYHILPNSALFKLCKQKYEHEVILFFVTEF